MRNRLPTCWLVRLQHGDAVRMEGSFDGAGDACCRPEQRASCLVVEIENCLDLRLGGHNHMAGVDLACVHEIDR
ncbi:hypothetical protein D3C72_2360860 [compost metagenome]